jgi:CRP/FNR family transcriptional regulator, anaerobic regulatory protein
MLNFVTKNLSPNDLALFNGLLKHASYAKGSVLIAEQTVADKLFFIEKGACRSYFLKEGEEITDFFFFEKSFATDFASFCSQKPSSLILECIEDCQVTVIHKKDLENLYTTNHAFSEIGRQMAEYSYLQIEERMRLLHTESLEIKYNWMLTHFPEIFQRVPQHYIATYLGVKPQSLSRIRAKISGKTY